MMSEDDKKNDDIKPEDDVVETVEAEIVEDDEVDDSPEEMAEEDVSFATLDQKLDEIAPPIIKKTGFVGLLLAAILGGVASIAIVAGVGYYLLKSDNLGSLFNDDEATNVAEQRYTDISTRVFSLEGELVELQSSELPEIVDLTPLNNQISALESALAGQGTTLVAQSESSVAQGKIIADIQASIANVANNSETGEFDTTVLIALQAEIDALKKKSGGIEPEIFAEIQGQIQAVQTQLTALEAELEVVKTAAEAAPQMSNSDASQMASALAVAALERALQDEAPFEVELNAIKFVAGDSEAFAKLSDYAAKGLASEVTLLGQFNDLLDQALVADLKGEGKSVLDKFIGNAKSVISIRKTGNVEGDDAEAVLARMEVAIIAKDLAKAVDIGASLDGPAKAVFAEWSAAANARLDAKNLMRKVSAEILTSLQ